MKRAASVMAALESAAMSGAGGLASDARESLAKALCSLRQPDGGFAGLDGKSDPYFSFFAWLSLRALDEPFDRDALLAYMAPSLPSRINVEVLCAHLLLLREGRRVRAAAWRGVVTAWLRGGSHDAYDAFLLGLLADTLLPRGVPRWVARRVWRNVAVRDWKSLPTPRLAAGVILASLTGEDDTGVLSALEARRCASGGFASAPGVPADLLATAVARFALWHRRLACEGYGPKACFTQADLAFIEACWLDDGLFGPFPASVRGDAEHTFYGLLALGTCR